MCVLVCAGSGGSAQRQEPLAARGGTGTRAGHARKGAQCVSLSCFVLCLFCVCAFVFRVASVTVLAMIVLSALFI